MNPNVLLLVVWSVGRFVMIFLKSGIYTSNAHIGAFVYRHLSTDDRVTTPWTRSFNHTNIHNLAGGAFFVVRRCCWRRRQHLPTVAEAAAAVVVVVVEEEGGGLEEMLTTHDCLTRAWLAN